ncbi:MAG: hypothetical protein GY909_19155 [Oligoflexia bacterium]|nr:hypothetical protein [Oligoflexia bacterium]
MKSTRQMNFLLSLLLLLNVAMVGCAQKDEIDPAFGVVPLNKQFEGKVINVSIPIVDGVSVDEFGTDFEDIPEVGGIFQELAGMFADITIDEENGTDVPIDPYVFYFPELDQVEDFSIIRELFIKQVSLKIAEAQDLEEASLAFIKKLEVYLSFNDPSEFDYSQTGNQKVRKLNKETGEMEEQDVYVAPGVLLLSYDSEKDQDRLGCIERCLELKPHKVDWVSILKKHRTFVIHTRLVVNSVPRSGMKIGGKVDVGLGINIGF